jgi:hypothetical protein
MSSTATGTGNWRHLVRSPNCQEQLELHGGRGSAMLPTGPSCNLTVIGHVLGSTDANRRACWGRRMRTVARPPPHVHGDARAHTRAELCQHFTRCMHRVHNLPFNLHRDAHGRSRALRNSIRLGISHPLPLTTTASGSTLRRPAAKPLPWARPSRHPVGVFMYTVHLLGSCERKGVLS